MLTIAHNLKKLYLGVTVCLEEKTFYASQSCLQKDCGKKNTPFVHC